VLPGALLTPSGGAAIPRAAEPKVTLSLFSGGGSPLEPAPRAGPLSRITGAGIEAGVTTPAGGGRRKVAGLKHCGPETLSGNLRTTKVPLLSDEALTTTYAAIKHAKPLPGTGLPATTVRPCDVLHEMCVQWHTEASAARSRSAYGVMLMGGNEPSKTRVPACSTWQR